MPPTSTDSTNNSTPSPNTSANSLDQFPHHSQESIRNLIAANFKQPNPRPQQQPHPQQRSLEPSHPTSNLHQVSSIQLIQVISHQLILESVYDQIVSNLIL